jgi:mannitol/fructose-specific phosphotransferase system IIA component (Ntr-type)/transcriptional regulator with XRE-family HTH domain
MRIEAGIGLRELARMIDISPSYLSMIENDQQPPPTPTRITQIEQALNVPKGYLQSLTHGFDPDLTSFVQEVPEILDFLHMARDKKMRSRDFMELAGVLNAYGLKGLRKAIKTVIAEADDATNESPGPGTAGPYLWPFLNEALVFDVAGVSDKETFLREAVHKIIKQTEGLDQETIFKGLLEREEAASTGLGHGVAVPHAYIDGLDRMVVACFRIPEGLDFDAVDGKPVYLVFILAGPRSSELLHLKLLARIAKLFNYNSFYERILEAPNQRQIIARFKAAEMSIP